jgi:hypothetical protein
MKKLLFFVLIASICTIAQTTSTDSLSSSKDTVNVRQLLMDQVSRIQENQKKSSEKQLEQNKEWGTSDKQDLNADHEILSQNLKFKYAAIILAMIISAVYFVMKRKNINKKVNKKKLKEKISFIRSEKPLKRERNELSIIRENLKKNAVFLSPHDIEISKSAKNLKIAKGELYLAAELKSLELTKIGNKNIKIMEM